ncbi:MAG: kynureninase [Phycisphaerales bacterium]|nr:kynureninase [Phycisphaerales bacterium]
MSAHPSASTGFRCDESFARELDLADPLARRRDAFHLPLRGDGSPAIYFCGNSLGLQPRTVRDAIDQELEDWARLAVDAHFDGRTPWYSYHEVLRESGARLVGALPGEVVHMNGLTVNLHLMMVSFYRPTPQRFKILMEDASFPSDTYAVRTQLRFHGLDPDSALLIARPREGEHTLRTEDVEALLDREGERIALVLLGGVNYFSGQVFDMERIARAARARGCVVGFDLAHAAGNVPLRLHDWGVDFAAWCTYKYLNCGPGSVAGCFVHERHHRDASLPRLGGWWGNDPSTRFRMHLNREFVPVAAADAWQLSNPPILSMAALKASLAIFDEVGMTALREKSGKLTGYLQYLIDRAGWQPHASGESARAEVQGSPTDARYEVITPREERARGCQLSILVHDRPKELLHKLHAEGVVCDFREPNVIRVAPVPLYNTYHEVWRFAQVLARHA